MMMSQLKTRRTEGVHVAGRAARVVENVLRATVEELAAKGYGGLRVEDVAKRSGVNKTTIYRSWPTKPDLVIAAMREAFHVESWPDTGNLRGDIAAMVEHATTFAASPIGRGLVRLIQFERATPEVDRITRTLRSQTTKARAQVVQRAIDRGELPLGTSADLVASLLFAPILTRLINFGETVDDRFVQGIVDVVLAGAMTGAARLE